MPRHTFNSQNQCVSCPSYCTSCEFNSNGKLICTACQVISLGYLKYQYYALNSESLCEICPSQCDNCFWKTSANKFGCYSCKNESYAFITNTNECLDNTNSAIPNLKGCLRGTYNETSKVYDCNSCKSGFIPILNDKKCLTPSEADLQSYCLEANNIGTASAPIYSCIRCENLKPYRDRYIYYPNVDVIDYRGAHDCYMREGHLYLCEKGYKDINKDVNCTNCISKFKMAFSEDYNKKVCIRECENNTLFEKNEWCYNCTDSKMGNPGCVLEKGCEYKSDNDQLNCNECKTGYFQYTSGQCFKCDLGNPPCKECHMNLELDRFECDKCIDGYFLNKDKKCELITCGVRPEVTPGCIICTDKLEEYKPQKKCQACSNGFFKTKNESCVYCKAQKNGGPACEICEYATYSEGKETNEIRCKYCPEGGFLTSDGKCYRCRDELENGCKNCTLKIDETEKTEKIICTECYENYALSKNDHCIHANCYAERIPHCALQYNYLSYIEEEEVNSTNGTYNISDEKNFVVSSYCSLCREGYYLYNTTIGGYCEAFNVSNCSLSNLYPNQEYFDYESYYKCNSKCGNSSQYVEVSFSIEIEQLVDDKAPINNNKYDEDEDSCSISSESESYYYEENDYSTSDSSYEDSNYDDSNYDSSSNTENESYPQIKTIKINLDVTRLLDNKSYYYEYGVEYETIEFKIMNIIANGHLYLDNLGTGDKFSPVNLRKCIRAEYIEINNTYQCVECVENYSLDEETKLCKQSISIKMNLKPGFDNCYVANYGNYSIPNYSCYRCISEDYILVTSESGSKYCVKKEGELAGCKVATSNTEYLNDVYNCSDCDVSYIPYYNIFFEKTICQDVLRKPDKIRELDSTIFDDVENVTAVNGECESPKLFTPDGKKCFACNNRTVGMVGCKGTCKFDLKKNITLKCEDDKCKTGFIEKSRGVCEPCETINKGCIECHYENNYLDGYMGLKRKRRFSCDQCDTGYLRSEDGTCHHCSTLGFSNCKNCGNDPNFDNELVCVECQPGYFVNNQGKCIYCSNNRIKGKSKTCIYCDDVEDGGIEGCEQCSNNENNEPKCNLCKNGFVLYEGNNTCLNISSNVELEELHHCLVVTLNNNNHFDCKKCDDDFVLLQENNNNIHCYYSNYVPTINPNLCEIFENLGNDDVTKFSCSKCKNLNENSQIQEIVRVTYKENNTAYCEYPNTYSSLQNCTEATMIIENGVKKLNCTSCIEDNILYYHKDTDLNICKYKYFEKQCVVKYCKTCRPGNNYFCQECLPTNYEVNPLTGGCVLKVDKVPSVHFKDIFRLQLNQHKQIGGRTLYGPFLSLRGLTNSQINTGHAFLVLLSFKLHYTRNNRNRNLEEEKVIKTYCEIVESNDYSPNETNIVDYDCIGDTNEEEEQNLDEYDLDGIKESSDENNGVFQYSNLDDLAEKTDLKNLKFKTKTTFELKDFVKIVTFSLNGSKNFTSKNYKFNFTLEGKIDKQLEPTSFNAEIPILQIKKKNASCQFIIKEEQNAEINCDLDFNEYKNVYNEFNFKVTTIENNNNSIYLAGIDEISLFNERIEENIETEMEVIKNKKKDNKVLVIVLSVVGSVLVAGGVGVFLYLYLKKKKLKVNENNNITNRQNIDNPINDNSNNKINVDNDKKEVGVLNLNEN